MMWTKRHETEFMEQKGHLDKENQRQRKTHMCKSSAYAEPCKKFSQKKKRQIFSLIFFFIFLFDVRLYVLFPLYFYFVFIILFVGVVGLLWRFSKMLESLSHFRLYFFTPVRLGFGMLLSLPRHYRHHHCYYLLLYTDAQYQRRVLFVARQLFDGIISL